VFEVSPDRPKIILATNIAEASLTIKDVKFVVDFGVSKVHGFPPSLPPSLPPFLSLCPFVAPSVTRALIHSRAFLFHLSSPTDVALRSPRTSHCPRLQLGLPGKPTPSFPPSLPSSLPASLDLIFCPSLPPPQASANQRRGRTGRVCDGYALRLYTRYVRSLPPSLFD
jgi:hypothetical protein